MPATSKNNWNLEEELAVMDLEDAALQEVRAANPWLERLDQMVMDLYEAVEHARAEGELAAEEEEDLREAFDRLESEVVGIAERLAREAGLLPGSV